MMTPRCLSKVEAQHTVTFPTDGSRRVFLSIADGDRPTCRAVVAHIKRMQTADLSIPIILSANRHVMGPPLVEMPYPLRSRAGRACVSSNQHRGITGDGSDGVLAELGSCPKAKGHIRIP